MLRKGYVDALDTPGFGGGGSYEPEGQPTMADYGRVPLEATRARGLERMHLFGRATDESAGALFVPARQLRNRLPTNRGGFHLILKGYANIPAGQVHYRRLHGPGLPVVCLHQTASSGAMWVKVMERMRGERPFVALDTPGFGGSFDPPQLPPSIGTYAEWLLESLDALGIGQFHVLCHHTGACIAVEMTARQPERVASVAMIGPVPLTEAEREEYKKYYSSPFSPTAEGEYLKTTWDYLRGLGAHGDLALHHRELLDTARAYMGRFMAYTNVWRQDFTKPFLGIRVPLLLMCAEDDVLWPFFGRAKEMRPDADSAVLKGANFEPDLDPDGVVGAYRAFLAKHGL